MEETIDAVFEKGVFRPLSPPAVLEGLRVRLKVEESRESNPDDLLKLASQVYQGLSSEKIEEIEQIALDRREFFGDGGMR
jgi:predicted DNA-binding antitoxin AbrB/MazE fold protein